MTGLRLDAISTENVWVYKEVRLRALAAFGNTHARKTQFMDKEWQRRAPAKGLRRGFLAQRLR